MERNAFGLDRNGVSRCISLILLLTTKNRCDTKFSGLCQPTQRGVSNPHLVQKIQPLSNVKDTYLPLPSKLFENYTSQVLDWYTYHEIIIYNKIIYQRRNIIVY